MPRRGRSHRSEIPPDPIYKNALVTRFVNCLMMRRQAEHGRAHLLRRDGRSIEKQIRPGRDDGPQAGA